MSGAPAAGRRQLADVRRGQLVEAMTLVASERGYAGSTVALVCERARLSPPAFYARFSSRRDCFLAVMDDGYEHARALISDAFARTDCWREGVRQAFAALLCLFESEPALARVWIVEPLAAGAWALERRERHLRALTRLVSERWPLPPGADVPPLAADGAMASALGLLQSRLLEGGGHPPLTMLLGPLMGAVTAPYLPPREVMAEVARGEQLARRLQHRPARASAASGARPRLGSPPHAAAILDPRAHRVRRCLLYLAGAPGASNREVADAIGVYSHTQASALLARLAGAGLLRKQAGAPGRPNAWWLTEAGGQAAGELRALSHPGRATRWTDVRGTLRNG